MWLIEINDVRIIITTHCKAGDSLQGGIYSYHKKIRLSLFDNNKMIRIFYSNKVSWEQIPAIYLNCNFSCIRKSTTKQK